jgi:hypothetical protein
MKEFELALLNMWKDNRVKEIFKYKNRIYHFREPLVNIELFFDMTYKMFEDVDDIANYNNSAPEDYKISIDELIQNRLSNT